MNFSIAKEKNIPQVILFALTYESAGPTQVLQMKGKSVFTDFDVV